MKKKSIGRSPEQTQIILQETYNSDLLLDNNYNTVAKEAFKGNPDGYRAVDLVADSFAKLDFKVYQLMTDGRKKYLKTHQFIKLIKKPNPYRGKYEYLYELAMYCMLSGQMFQQQIQVQCLRANTPT
jgi:phage portal protein BeeE